MKWWGDHALTQVEGVAQTFTCVAQEYVTGSIPIRVGGTALLLQYSEAKKYKAVRNHVFESHMPRQKTNVRYQ